MSKEVVLSIPLIIPRNNIPNGQDDIEDSEEINPDTEPIVEWPEGGPVDPKPQTQKNLNCPGNRKSNRINLK
jgi:hypothetical protein